MEAHSESGEPMDLKKILEDQRAFNKQIWETDSITPFSNARSMARLKDLSLGMVEETLEFLRTFEYKPHRRKAGRLQNVAHSHEELIDMFKFWLSLADLVGLTPEKIEELYWAKSRVVRYRYQEEWAETISGPCVIVDIDGVLADYYSGMLKWMRAATEIIVPPWVLDRIKPGTYLNAETLQVTPEGWRQIKHEFRVSGCKQNLPMYPDAKDFLDWCKRQGWLIVLVTSRPIDAYPNLFTDTMMWLDKNNLPFDHLWWATEKAERIENANVLKQTVFAIDDDIRYVEQFRKKGVYSYWLVRHDGWNLNRVREEWMKTNFTMR